MTHNTNYGPTTIDKILTFSPFCLGPLSVLGSCAILYNILSDPQRRFTTPYYRIMFALSVSDLFYAITRMFSTFAIPKGTPGYYYAAGNQATCDVQGFFLHLGLTQPMYTASLCIYFLLVIKYSKSDEYISKKLEPWMHIVSIGYPLVTAIASVSMKLYNPARLGCFIVEYPEGCVKVDKNTCLRGRNSSVFFYLFACVTFISSFIVISWCMTSIVLFVRKREKIMNQRFSFKSSDLTRSKYLSNCHRYVVRQAILYVSSFVLVWSIGFIARLVAMNSDRKLLFLLCVHQLTSHLQGLFNCIIFVLPRYCKMRDENPEKSFFWLLKDSLLTRTREKVKRRASGPLLKVDIDALRLSPTKTLISGKDMSPVRSIPPVKGSL